MIILKFGGTSVSSRRNIKTIVEVVKTERKKQPILVVSAVSGVTDLLLQLSNAKKVTQRKKIIKEIERIHLNLLKGFHNGSEMIEYIRKSLDKANSRTRNRDELVALGEIMSSYIISRVLHSEGIESEQIVATSIIVSDSNFGNAEFIPNLTRKKVKKIIPPLIKAGIVPVVTGFIAATKEGKTTTLGRGGSDYTAAIIGYCLNAEEVQIWTDVDGIFTADPRFVKKARQLRKITYKEASELAAFGAKVLHPRTIRPLIPNNIPIVVKNTFSPNSEGTSINGELAGRPRITAIASRSRVTLVNLYSAKMLFSRGFLERIFSVFAKHNISVDLVSVSEVSVSVTLDNNEDLLDALEELKEFATTSRSQVGVVSLIGENILETNGVLKNVFSALNSARIPVKMLSLGASDINISIVVDTDFVSQAVNILHDGIILERRKR